MDMAEVDSFYRQAILQTERKLLIARINDLLEVEGREDCGNLPECLGRLYEDYDSTMNAMAEAGATLIPPEEPEG